MTDRPTPDEQPTPDRFLTRADGDKGGEARDAGPAEAFAIDLARLFRDDKCSDVVVLDVRGSSPLTDYLVVASGTSERQMRSVLDHAVELAAERAVEPFAVTKDAGTLWVIADFVDVVAHLFEPNTRAHYDLEMLWGDAKTVPWDRPERA